MRRTAQAPRARVTPSSAEASPAAVQARRRPRFPPAPKGENPEKTMGEAFSRILREETARVQGTVDSIGAMCATQ